MMNAKFSHDHGSLSHGHHIQDKLLVTNYLAQNFFPPKKCCITFFKKVSVHSSLSIEM